ncbi:MAG: DUF4345 domain-containing protein [Chloroflexota bacterium]
MKRTLQIILFVLSLVPLRTVIRGFIVGSSWGAIDDGFLVDFDSHYRYLSAVYIAITLTLWWVIPNIEKHTTPLRIVALAVFLGGINRLVSLFAVGVPTAEPIAWLVLELVAPFILLAMHETIRVKDKQEPEQILQSA